MEGRKDAVPEEEMKDAVPEEEMKDAEVTQPEHSEGEECDGGDCGQPPVEEIDDSPDKALPEVNLVTLLPKGSKIYVKKPVQIRAVLMTEAFAVKTLEGVMTGKAGDYLIEGIKGELYPCKPDIFVESYQAT